jgi:hypothetical protein
MRLARLVAIPREMGERHKMARRHQSQTLLL